MGKLSLLCFLFLPSLPRGAGFIGIISSLYNQVATSSEDVIRDAPASSLRIVDSFFFVTRNEIYIFIYLSPVNMPPRVISLSGSIKCVKSPLCDFPNVNHRESRGGEKEEEAWFSSNSSDWYRFKTGAFYTSKVRTNGE